MRGHVVMASLFQDEPDEDSGPELLQNEPEERPPGLFQDEPAEKETRPPLKKSSGNRHGSHGQHLLQDEPDECGVPQHSLFGVENDEAEDCSLSDSSSSAYLGEDEKDNDMHTIVQLNFSTINKFLTSQLDRVTTPKSTTEPGKKKRRYNNQNRARLAESRKNAKPSTGRHFAPRNCSETWM